MQTTWLLNFLSAIPTLFSQLHQTSSSPPPFPSIFPAFSMPPPSPSLRMFDGV